MTAPLVRLDGRWWHRDELIASAKGEGRLGLVVVPSPLRLWLDDRVAQAHARSRALNLS